MLRERAALVDAGVAQRVRIVAGLYGGERVSGQALAEVLGVSRAAIHKHMETLRDLGFVVSSAAGSGYRLDPPVDLVSPEAVLPLLASASTGLGLPFRYEPTVPSTNTIARGEGAAGAPHGTIVVTDYQHTGRGRLGRTWLSEPGKDLTFSLLLRPVLPPERAARLTLAASVAVAETLAEAEEIEGRVSIKWPNDVLIDGRKACGILSEASLDMDSLHWVVVGMGLNINGMPGANLEGVELAPGPTPPISMREAAGRRFDRAPLLVRLLCRLDERLTQAAGKGWAGVLASFTLLDALEGQAVEVRTGGEPARTVVSGVARGVGTEGELLVEDPTGTVCPVLSGDVTLRRASGSGL